ncbi:hypothetical protein Hdeb2414_s0046g00746541 [Helianthus debilis subsp. tardiflorus]
MFGSSNRKVLRVNKVRLGSNGKIVKSSLSSCINFRFVLHIFRWFQWQLYVICWLETEIGGLISVAPYICMSNAYSSKCRYSYPIF